MSKEEKGPMNRHKEMAMGEKIKVMKKGGKVEKEEKKACGGMMKKGGKVKK